jgi:hypothetical protein
MLVRQKSTGRYLTLRGGFRKPLTCTQSCALMHSPKYVGLVSTTADVFPKVCKQLRLDPAKLELMPSSTDAY